MLPEMEKKRLDTEHHVTVVSWKITCFSAESKKFDELKYVEQNKK